MFNLKVMVIKTSKMFHFLYFLLMTAKHQSQIGQPKYLSTSERPHLALLENTIDHWVLNYH